MEIIRTAQPDKLEEMAVAAAEVAPVTLGQQSLEALPLKHRHLAQPDTEIMAARVVPEVLPFTLAAEAGVLALLEEPQRLQITVETAETGKRFPYPAAAFTTAAVEAVRYGITALQREMAGLAAAEVAAQTKPPQELAAGLH